MEKITYGFYDSSFGKMVLGKTDKGLCWLGFMVKGYKGDGLERMKAHFKTARFVQNDSAIKDLAVSALAAWEKGQENLIVFDLRGTDFQKTVWSALLRIPKGQSCSYGDIANDIGKPMAARSVGTAIGENPVSLLVPCHRVLKSDGAIGNYGWGVQVKRDILRAEGMRI